jgi:CRP-like cAMP-binding protein
LLTVIQTRLKKAQSRSNQTNTGAGKPHLSDPERGRVQLEKSFNEEGRAQLFDHGHSVVREGEYPHFIYRVNTGHVHLVRSHEYGRDYIIAELGPGEIFAIPSVLERAAFHYTAKVASETASLQLLASGKLLTLLNTDRTISEALMYLLASRVVENSERLVHQAYDSVRRRTALVLCDLHEKYGKDGVELSRDELSQMVGSTKESVIRALSDFKREGLLTAEGKKIVISDVAALRGLLV